MARILYVKKKVFAITGKSVPLLAVITGWWLTGVVGRARVEGSAGGGGASCRRSMVEG
jgi:hypothetical protein